MRAGPNGQGFGGGVMAPTPKRKGSFFGRLGTSKRFLLPISISHDVPANKLAVVVQKVRSRFSSSEHEPERDLMKTCFC